MLVVTTSWHRFGMPEGLFADEEVRHGVHGGAIETSIMMAAYPDLVRTDKIGNFRSSAVAMDKDYRWLSAHRPAPFAWQTQDLHRSGAIGDASAANADKGRQLLAHGAGAFVELLADVHQFDPAVFNDQI
jgi:creatinine amidohydrolase